VFAMKLEEKGFRLTPCTLAPGIKPDINSIGQIGGHEGVGSVENLGPNVEEPRVICREWLADICNNYRK
jgi:hypothetical protein